ncbi:MAG: DNA polymerase III subunit beta [Dehalococcoidales bacterium]|nr:DNA polymerase III subunit beta [Dehalococcoidales bacterium]
MDIRVSKLKEVMDLVKPAVPKNPSVKVIAHLHLGNGKATATDLETMIVVNVPEANEPVLLPYYSIADMLKYVPGYETLHIEQTDKIVRLTWLEGNASYPTEETANFPILPELKIRGEGLLDGDVLVTAVANALPYVAEDEKRPILNGITLVLGTPVEVAAGDGFRMSHQAMGLSFPLEEKVIIPAHSVAIIEHIFKKTPRTPPSNADTLVQAITSKRLLRVALVGDNKIRMDFGTTATIYINLIEGNPPEWLALIPKGEPVLQCQLFVPQFEAAVKRVRDIAKEGSGLVRMELSDGRLKLSAKKDAQEVSTSVGTILSQGEPGRTALNQQYLVEYLSGKQGIVSFSKYTDTGPVVFEYQNAPRVLIMPMADDVDKPATSETQSEPAETEEETESSTEDTPEEVEETAPTE